jgi:two-component system, OmpR family, alkaline phosphatase synthesis response regulator PhoP
LTTKILFVEDELTLQKSITYILEKEGFSVITATTGEDAVKLALRENPDLILLDLVLPGIDGFEVCEILKRNPATANIFIVMLTGKRLVEDITRGLCQYADDYITKPFEPAILLARLQAVLRRKLKTAKTSRRLLRFSDLLIDSDGREVTIQGKPVALTKTEFDLLLLLARHPNIVLSRAKVLDHIRRDDFEPTDRVVDYQVSGLRKKIAPAGQFIETVRGIGYKFKV